MSISLLPDELRKKEEEEKNRAKQARLNPQFKMYVPGKQTFTDKPAPSFNKSAIPTPSQPTLKPEDKKVPVEQPPKPVFVSEKKQAPVFNQNQSANKFEKPVTFRQPEKPAPIVPPVVNKVQEKIETMPPRDLPKKPEYRNHNWHYPEEKKFEKTNGKQVVRDSSDQFQEIKKSPSFSDSLKKEAGKPIEPKIDPEVDLMEKNYAAAVRKEFWARLKSFSSILLLMVLLFGVAFAVLKIYQLEQIKKYNQIANDLAAAEQEISLLQSSAAQAGKLTNRALALETVVNKHLYWTKFLDFLEHNTVKNVYYLNFVAGDNGEVLLLGHAPSYTDVAAQLMLFQTSEFLSGVEINTMNMIQDRTSKDALAKEVEFNVMLKLKDDSLLK